MTLGGEEDDLVPLLTPVKPSSQIPYPPPGKRILSEARGYGAYNSVEPSDLPLHHRNAADKVCEPDDAIAFTAPTRLLARFNLLLLVLAYSLLGKECVHVRSSLRNDDGSYTSPLSKWKVADGHDIALRLATEAGSEVVAVLRGGDICYLYGKEPITAKNPIRAHIVAPKNGWATVSLATGNPHLELVDDNLPVSFCPLVASGTWYSDTSLFKQAPTALVVSQQLWNAAQVGQIFLLLCLYVTTSNFPVPRVILSVIFIGLAVIMPFSVYVSSPGGAIFATVSFSTAAVAALKTSDVRVTLMDLPPLVFGGRIEYTKTSIVNHSLFKVEFIACLCNLFSSMYNYSASKTRFPYWDHMFRSLDGLLGLVGKTAETNMDVLDQMEYTMGLDIHVPLFVPVSHGSTIGTRIFLVLWCWIPSLYVLYFGTMFVNSVKAPGRRIQQSLSAMGIFHFLFLTDVVAYKFGRGVHNPGERWFHWQERLCWRIAILLPIYQNVMTGHWKHGNRIGWIGRGLHYSLAIWTVPYFINDVVKPGWRLYLIIRGKPSPNWREMFGWDWDMLSYHGALVLQALVYFCMVMGLSSCHHLFTGRLSACHDKSRTKPGE